MKCLGILICFLCVNYLEASTTYKAAIFNNKEIKFENIESVFDEAAKSNADILVLPVLGSSESADNYDEIVKALSTSAKNANLYLVAHLYEKSRCQNNIEVIRSNVVFDRKGSIVSVYRKSSSNQINCTASPSELVTFTTDFGVTFGLLMNEDIVIHNFNYMKGLRNFVMTGAGNGLYVSAAQLPSSWSFVNNVNLVSSNGVYGSNSGFKTRPDGLVMADFDKDGNIEHTIVPSIYSEGLSSEDLKHLIIKPLDLEASGQGYKENLCFNTFCCEFYAKTRANGQNSEVSYVLAAFDGVQPFSDQHNVGLQSCMLYACADVNERSCELRPNYNINILFEKLSVTANYTEKTAQYPIIQSNLVLPMEKMKFTKSQGISTQVTLELDNSENLMKFGILGRDYSKDIRTFAVQRNNSESTYDIYDFIFNEDVQEFFDYVWIRLRILLVVVSIYVLEMM